jgi:RND family efflux transporter MFP subunit
VRRVASILAALVVVGVALAGGSLVRTGTPAFGLLAGTGWQERLTPGFVAAGDRGGGRERAPLTVATAPVTRGEMPVTLSFSGELQARRRVEIRARVTGYLAERVVDEASFVDAGAVLFRLRTREFEARVAELAAQLDGAEANLAFLRRETARIGTLEGEDFATTSRLDELRSRRAEARARRDELEAALRLARLDLDYAEITAPFAGKVGFAEVDPGDLVTANQTRLVELVEYDPMEVEFRPSAEQLARLRARLAETGGVAVRVRLDGDPEVYGGEIDALGAAFEDATNTIPVRAELANPERRLVPGQFARVTAALGERPVLLVPSEALVTHQDQRALYRVDAEGRVEVVPVTAGRTQGERTAVAGELAAGDRVVAGKLQRVRPGTTVRPLGDGQGER